VQVERVTISADRVTVVLRLDPGEPLRTSAVPGLPERAVEALPGLTRHRCDNGAGRTFSAELRDTETAHLFEHVACELMALAGSPRTLRGETSWDFVRDGRGVFHVSLQYDDDLVVLGALKAARRVVTGLIADSDRPDIDAEVARLRALRGSDGTACRE
jgi:cyanophycin synthetase